MAFHSAFERCVSRVIYKKDWATSRPAIMRHNNWPRCNSEVLIRYERLVTHFSAAHSLAHSLTPAVICTRSTTRRFGKTFRYAAHT